VGRPLIPFSATNAARGRAATLQIRAIRYNRACNRYAAAARARRGSGRVPRGTSTSTAPSDPFCQGGNWHTGMLKRNHKQDHGGQCNGQRRRTCGELRTRIEPDSIPRAV